MGKLKFLMIIFLVVVFSGIACAVEVINIDLNGYGDTNAYVGTAGYDDGINEWQVYYGTWGLPMGSPRSSGLTYQNDPNTPPGIYAAQIWIGDPGANHDYLAGTALLDDGFVKSAGATADPTINLIGGEGAYGGTYDIYVYGNSAGSFTLTDSGTLNETKSVTGTVSGFVETENYVVFTDITVGAAGDVVLTYTNELNGLQLVSTKQPFVILGHTTDPNDLIIDAREYDVAYDTNGRDGEISLYGPDLGNAVHYLDGGEYMEYDITVDAANKGQYEISADVVIYWGAASHGLYLDGNMQGTLALEDPSGNYGEDEGGNPIGNPDVQETNKLLINLTEGTHIIKWTTGLAYNDIYSLNLDYFGPLVINDCDDVFKFGLNYPGDVNGDCRVNLEDVVVMAADWTRCNDPEDETCE